MRKIGREVTENAKRLATTDCPDATDRVLTKGRKRMSSATRSGRNLVSLVVFCQKRTPTVRRAVAPCYFLLNRLCIRVIRATCHAEALA
jgi:hypothetical protein